MQALLRALTLAALIGLSTLGTRPTLGTRADRPPGPAASSRSSSQGPVSVQLVATVTGSVKRAVASGSYAYLCFVGLRILDITDAANPLPVGACGGFFGDAIALSHGYAFAASSWADLCAVRVSDPRAPAKVACIRPGSAIVEDIAVSWPCVYIAGWHGVSVVDVRDPAYMTKVTVINSSLVAFGVDVSGTRLYVAGEQGLGIFSVADPMSPRELGRRLFVYTWATARDVAVQGDYAYVIDEWNRLHVIDVLDPSRLSDTGACDMPADDEVWSIALLPTWAYQAEWAVVAGQDVHVVDVRDPSHPAVVAHYDIPAQGVATVRVATDGDLAFVAAGYYGLFILRVTDVPSVTPTATSSPTPTASRRPTPTLTPSPTATATPRVQGRTMHLPIVIRGGS